MLNIAAPGEDLQTPNEEVIFTLTITYELIFKIQFGFEYYLPKHKAQTAKHMANNIYFKDYEEIAVPIS